MRWGFTKVWRVEMLKKNQMSEEVKPPALMEAVEEYIDSIIKELQSTRQALADTKAHLEALEDAVCKLTMGGNKSKEVADIINQAVENSYKRL